MPKVPYGLKIDSPSNLLVIFPRKVPSGATIREPSMRVQSLAEDAFSPDRPPARAARMSSALWAEHALSVTRGKIRVHMRRIQAVVCDRSIGRSPSGLIRR